MVKLIAHASLKLLCVIPVPLVRWILVGAAFLLSGFFLVSNIYPILAAVSFAHSVSDHTDIVPIGRPEGSSTHCRRSCADARSPRPVLQGLVFQLLRCEGDWTSRSH